MGQPDISIIVLTYNHEEYIGECLQSIIDQTFDGWEAIVVDDGSLDSTWAIVREFAARDKRIRAVRQENQGIGQLANTINKALALTEGKLIAAIGGDDYWPKEKLEIQVGLHREHPNLILSYGRVLLTREGAIIGEYCFPPIIGMRSSADYLRLALLLKSCILPIGVVIKASSLREIGGYHQEFGFPGEDYPTYLRLLQLGGQAICIEDVVGYYRQSEGQITRSHGYALSEGALKIAINQFESLPNELREYIGISKPDIVKSHVKNSRMPNCLNEARKALILKDKESAIWYGRELVRYGDVKRKLQGLYTVVAAHFGWTMEPILEAYDKYILQQSA